MEGHPQLQQRGLWVCRCQRRERQESRQPQLAGVPGNHPFSLSLSLSLSLSTNPSSDTLLFVLFAGDCSFGWSHCGRRCRVQGRILQPSASHRGRGIRGRTCRGGDLHQRHRALHGRQEGQGHHGRTLPPRWNEGWDRHQRTLVLQEQIHGDGLRVQVSLCLSLRRSQFLLTLFLFPSSLTRARVQANKKESHTEGQLDNLFENLAKEKLGKSPARSLALARFCSFLTFPSPSLSSSLSLSLSPLSWAELGPGGGQVLYCVHQAPGAPEGGGALDACQGDESRWREAATLLEVRAGSKAQTKGKSFFSHPFALRYYC